MHIKVLHSVRDHDFVRAAMAKARCYVQHYVRTSNSDSEGSPVVLPEAQCSGLPAVASRHAGIPDVVEDGTRPRKCLIRRSLIRNHVGQHCIQSLIPILRKRESRDNLFTHMKGAEKTMNHRDNMPLVSIGIPTYNRAASYLPQTLESALHQTYENLEIIVSDNGSTDNTESLVKHHGDARIKYHKQDPALSPNENFNYCLNAAQGEYFLLLHDDDLIDPDFVEVCICAVRGRPEVGIIRTGTRVIDGTGKAIKEKKNQAGGLSTAEFFLAWFSGKTSLYLPGTLFNRRALQKIGGFESRHNLFQDVIAEVSLAAGYGRIDIEDVKAGFRVHDGEFTFAVSVNDWCEDAADLLDFMVELAPEKKEEVRRRGEEFFTELNYNRAIHIRSRAARYRMYVDIYRRFNSRLSPLEYFCIKPVKRRALKRIKHLRRGVGLSPSSAIGRGR